MSIDAKQKVLLAIYMEYQKDVPDMKSITQQALGLEYDVFATALQKLMNEELIAGVTFTMGGRGTVPVQLFMDSCKMTKSGLEYVEEKSGINKTDSNEEKVKTLLGKVAEWGLDQVKDFGARVLAEILKK